MKLSVFAIYDTKALVYGTPFFMDSPGRAVRAFSDLANDRQSAINKHPSDYMLWEIAIFDDNTGRFVSLDIPKNWGLGSDFLEVSAPKQEQFDLPLNGAKKVEVLS